MSIFSETLVMLRERRNMEPQELAVLLNISAAHIKRLETDYASPDENLIAAIAAIFEVSPSYLLGIVSREFVMGEPGFGNTSKKYVSVPVVSTKFMASAVCRESDIIDRVVLPIPDNSYDNYIAVLVDEDCGINRIMKGDMAIIKRTTQLTDGDIVAVKPLDSDIIFIMYKRVGLIIHLYCEKTGNEITYNSGAASNSILGKVVAVQSNF